LPTLNYLCPTTSSELKKILKKKKTDSFILAGGTDLLVKIRHNVVKPKEIIDIKKIKKFNEIKLTKTQLNIGCAATLNEIAENKTIKEKFPAIADGSLSIGSTQIRNRGTLVGNLCNSSPVADTVPGLLIYDAKIKILSPTGTKTVSIHDFITGVGKNILKKNEIVESVILPLPKNTKSAFLKNARRKALDLSSVNVAVGLFNKSKKNPDIRIAVGACAPITKRAQKAEKFLKKNGLTDETIKKAAKMLPISPISDLRGSKEFRNKIAHRLFIKLATQLGEV